MYLATMMNMYSEQVAEIDIKATRDQVEKERQFWVAEYKNKEALKNEITIVYGTENTKVWVDKVTPGSASETSGVKGGGENVGHMIFKVNGEKDTWKVHMESAQRIMEDGIQDDPRDGFIRITYKEPPRKSKYDGLLKFFAMSLNEDDDDNSSKFRATVKNFWRNHGAVTWTQRKVINEERVEEENEEQAGQPEGADDEEEDDDEAGEENEPANDSAAHSKDRHTTEASKASKRLVKQRLDALLFSRYADGRRGGAAGGGAGGGDGQLPGEEELDEHVEEEAQDDTQMDIDELRVKIETMPVTGEEAWLDCLLTAIEREVDDESQVTEVFRTNEMQEMGTKAQSGAKEKTLKEFYDHANKVLQILEYKACKRYYHSLRDESVQKQEMLKKQNEVLHDYACELEKEFTTIMEGIHSFSAKKKMMLMKLGGVLDRETYRSLDKSSDQDADSKEHLKRLTKPWPESHGSGG